MDCTRSDLLLGLLEDELDEDERASVEAHLDGCQACREALDGYRSVRGTLQQLEPPRPSDEARSRAYSAVLELMNQAAPAEAPAVVPASPARPRGQIIPFLRYVAAAAVFLLVASLFFRDDDAGSVATRGRDPQDLPTVQQAPSEDAAPLAARPTGEIAGKAERSLPGFRPAPGGSVEEDGERKTPLAQLAAPADALDSDGEMAGDLRPVDAPGADADATRLKLRERLARRNLELAKEGQKKNGRGKAKGEARRSEDALGVTETRRQRVEADRQKELEEQTRFRAFARKVQDKVDALGETEAGGDDADDFDAGPAPRAPAPRAPSSGPAQDRDEPEEDGRYRREQGGTSSSEGASPASSSAGAAERKPADARDEAAFGEVAGRNARNAAPRGAWTVDSPRGRRIYSLLADGRFVRRDVPQRKPAARPAKDQGDAKTRLGGYRVTMLGPTRVDRLPTNAPALKTSGQIAQPTVDLRVAEELLAILRLEVQPPRVDRSKGDLAPGARRRKTAPARTTAALTPERRETVLALFRVLGSVPRPGEDMRRALGRLERDRSGLMKRMRRADPLGALDDAAETKAR